jgi:DNA-binding MarR family transcriptional regulator
VARDPGPDDAVRLALAIKRIRARMRAESPSAGGWTTSQLSTLARIIDHGPITAAAIAQAEHVRPQSIASIVTTLREAGLITTEPDPADGRKLLLSPTDDGRQLIASISTSRQEWLARALDAVVGPDERAALAATIELLNRLADCRLPLERAGSLAG